jgi:hypothetical protein
MITSDKARGDSIAVTLSDYQRHAKHGATILAELTRANVRPYARDLAWRRTRDAWGGVTLTTERQSEVSPTSGYAVAVSRGDTIAIPADADAVKFRESYELAVRRFAYAPYLGIFRDDDIGMIEFDAVVIVATEVAAREIATACESLGGAYDFSTGNGVFHYHVAD